MKRYFFLGMGISLMVAALCAVAGVFVWRNDQIMGLLGLRAQNDMAEILPADSTMLYAGLSLNLQNQQGYQTIKELYLDDPQFKALFNDAKEGAEEEGDIDFEQDVRPWLGTEAGVAMLAVPAYSGEDALYENDFGRMRPLIAVAVTDMERARAFLLEQVEREGLDVEERSHSAVSYWIDEGGPVEEPRVVALFNDMIVYSSDESVMQDAIDQAQSDEGSLAQDAQYQRVRNALPTEALAFMMMNQAVAYDTFLAPLMETMPMNWEGEALADQMEASQLTGVSVVLEREGVRIDSAQLYDEDALDPATAALLRERSGTHALLEHVPSDALLFMTVSNVDGMLEQSIAQMKAMDTEGLFESLVLGGADFDLEQDLLPWVGEEVLLSLSSTPNEIIPVSGWLMMDSRDATASDTFLDRMADQIGGESMSQQVGEHTFRMFDDGFGGEPYMSMGMMGDRVVATMPGAAVAAVADAPSDPITVSENFRQMQGLLPAEYSTLFYLNFDEMEALLRPMIATTAEDERIFEAIMGPMAAFGATSGGMQDGLLRGHAFLTLK